MTFEQFKNKIFMEAKKIGIDNCEIYYSKSSSFHLDSQDFKIEKYSDSNTYGVGLKAIKDGKAGFAYSEMISENAADFLVQKAYDNLKYIESDYEEFFFSPGKEYKKLPEYVNELSRLKTERKIDIVTSLERKTKALDERIVLIQNCAYNEFYSERRIVNTLGLDLYSASGGGIMYIMAVASEGGKNKMGIGINMFEKPEDINIDYIAKKAKNDAVEKLNARSTKSGKYKILFKNSCWGSMMNTFVSMFSAENVQKGLSRLKDKLNEQISSEIITLIDDPVLKNSYLKMTFDDQGVPTRKKYLIKNGVLNNYLYDLKTAKKDNCESTGNGIKSSYKSNTSIRPINLTMKSGQKTYTELIEQLENGLIITSVEGLHSGANPISGDFSLGAQGFIVKNGKIISGLEQVTISGNILNLLENVEQIGNDFDYALSFFPICYFPSVIVKELDIAGD